MTAPKLSIVIVAWNCADLLRNCLESLEAAQLDFPHEILVVDNASQDDTLAMVESRFPHVRTIANPHNIGFAGANNLGIAQTSGEHILLLNPDTLIHRRDALHRLVEFMDTHPAVTAAGCRLLHEDGRHQVGDAGFCPTLASVLVHSLFLNRIFPRNFKGVFLSGNEATGDSLVVGWVCAAAMILRRAALPLTGMMRDDIFLYGEDMDWGCRMSRMGLELHYLPDIHITHIQGGTQKGAKSVSTKWIDGLARTFWELNPSRHWWGFKMVMAVGFLLRAAAASAGSVVSGGASSRQRFRAMRTYLAHILSLQPGDFQAPGSKEPTSVTGEAK